jgi:uncharacterized protein YecE (DUF72 family)
MTDVSPRLPYSLGCPVWACPQWKGSLYTADAARGDWLGQYSSVFQTVEGNSTFYSLPSLETVKRWAGEARPGLAFALKFPRLITHERRLRDAAAETRAFLAVLSVLRDAGRLGPSFLQLPPNFDAREFPALEGYLRQLPRGFPYAVEVRHRDYFDQRRHEPALDDLLRSHAIDRVLFDSRALYSAPPSDDAEHVSQTRKPRSPLRFTVTGSRPFLRIVGRNDVTSVRPWLAEWSAQVAGWIDEGLHPFVFTHTPDDQFAPQMAELFHEELHRRRERLPLLAPWPGRLAQKNPRQQSLF